MGRKSNRSMERKDLKMQNDLTIINHAFGEDVTIYPVADVHLGALEADENAWNGFVRMVREDPTAKVLLLGDLVNNATKSSVSDVYKETMTPAEQKAAMVRYLEPLQQQIIGAVSGNHEQRTSKESGQDITYDILAKLDLEDLYRESMAFIKIGLGSRTYKGDIKPRCTYMIAATHGAGSGMTGAVVNRGERFGGIIDGVDIIFTAHSHKGAVTRPQKIVFDPQRNKVSFKTYTLVSTESWLTWGGYAARKMLLPAETCRPPKIRLHSDLKNVEVIW